MVPFRKLAPEYDSNARSLRMVAHAAWKQGPRNLTGLLSTWHTPNTFRVGTRDGMKTDERTNNRTTWSRPTVFLAVKKPIGFAVPTGEAYPTVGGGSTRRFMRARHADQREDLRHVPA